MAWVRTDDVAPLHPKFFRAGVAAYGLWHACLSYCNRYLTDGFIPGRDMVLAFPGTPPDEVMALTEILVREGLLEVCGDGYRMHDYLHYQPRKKDVLKVRRLRSMAGRQGGVTTAKRLKQVAAAHTAGLAGLPTRPDPTRPDPVLETKKSIVGLTPDVTPLNGYRQEARDLLEFLNTKAGRAYRPTPANLAFIEARLKAGASVEDCRGVIVRKVRAWSTDPKMAPYLRPATLFNATKFDQYIGEQGRPS